MMPFLADHHGNPGSLHRAGRKARKAVEQARAQVAALIHAEAREIIFTGSGTEANNLIISGLHSLEEKHRRLPICTSTEHHSVLEPTRTVRDRFNQAKDFLSVNVAGLVEQAPLAEALSNKPRLISVMLANNEVGTIQALEEISQQSHREGVIVHTDAVQAAGKIPIDVRSLEVDALTLSAHKIQGPKGIGACFIKHGTGLSPMIQGGAQENGRRAGTENVASIVGFGTAAALASRQQQKIWQNVACLRSKMESELLRTIPSSWINGVQGPRLPHISNIAFEEVEGEQVMLSLDAEGIAVGTGSACSSGSLDPSHVLLAMGQSHEQAHAAIRISLSPATSEEDIQSLCNKLPGIIDRLRNA